MEIYVQEVGALQFLPRLEESVKNQVLQGVALFPWNLDLAWRLQAAQVPETIWFVLVKSEAGLSTHGLKHGEKKADGGINAWLNIEPCETSSLRGLRGWKKCEP